MFRLFILSLLSIACQNHPAPNTTGANQPAVLTANTTAPRDTIVPPQYDANGKLVTIQKSAADWKRVLTSQEYNVLREEGTERAFSGDLVKNHDHGVYTCAACGLPLFSSETKFESGTGWPSFYQPFKSDAIKEVKDDAHGMVRVEVECARCGGHQGHVFDDGPNPTGLRYCINSAALDFVKQ